MPHATPKYAAKWKKSSGFPKWKGFAWWFGRTQILSLIGFVV
jgi:hypothetical protein